MTANTFPSGFGLPLGLWGGVGVPGTYPNQTTTASTSGGATGTSNPYLNGTLTPYGQNNSIITIRVPYSAEVWVQNERLDQTGEERKYVTPPLDINRWHNYDIRASWLENGNKVDLHQQVPVRGGTQTSVNFLGADSDTSSRKNDAQNSPIRPVAFQGTNEKPTRIEVQVPENAQVWIEGKKMASTGTTRRFVTPTLNPGRTYTYDIRVQWNQDGRDVSTDRQITIRGGEQKKLAFAPTTSEPSQR